MARAEVTGKKIGPDSIDRRNDRIMKLKEQCEVLGVNRSTHYRKRKRDSRFPQPVHVTANGYEVWESDFYVYLEVSQREPHPPSPR